MSPTRGGPIVGCVVFLMAGALAMAWGRCVALLLLLPAPRGLGQRLHPEPGLPGLRHSYDCGVKGMQLLVFPGEGQTIRFKVMDEFGNQFDVNNCSICYHWVTATPQGPTVFSADYKGCHVLEKDGSSHLQVFIEAVLPNGHVDVAQNVTLVCPKPDHTWTTPDSQLVPSATFSLSTPQTHPPHPTTEHSFIQPTSASPSLGSGPAQPTWAQPTWAQPTWAQPTWAQPTWAQPTWAQPTWAHPHRSTLENWEVDKPDYIGTHLSPEQCQGDSGHIPCIVRSSKEACQQAGCCYDNTRDAPCYYGNTATAQCFRNGHLVLVFSRKMALAHRITLASVHLAYAPTRCSPTQETGSFVVFHVPLTHCGTTVQVVGNQLIYENQLVSDIEVQTGPRGSITRDSTFRLHIRCIFNASDFLPLQASVFPPPSPASVTQPGPLRLELRIAKDETFRSYYEEKDYPIVRLLLEPVPLEVRLLQRTDPRLVLVLHRCWATPSANPVQQPQWPILEDGCPFEGDSYRTRMVVSDKTELPFPAHYQRFTVATFAFLDSGSRRALRGPVYFFCSASACAPSGLETCSSACGARTARQRRSSSRHGDTAQPQNIVSSPGPVGFVDAYRKETTLGPSGSTRLSDRRLLLWVVLSLVAVALALGIGVFVGLSRAQVRRLQEGNRG